MNEEPEIITSTKPTLRTFSATVALEASLSTRPNLISALYSYFLRTVNVAILSGRSDDRQTILEATSSFQGSLR